MLNKTKQAFNKGILNIIDLMKYKIYVINRETDILCTCYNTGTSQADPNCPRCLGTGYKLKIRETEAACNETGAPSVMRNSTEFVVSRTYYIPNDIRLNNDDIIVDNGEPWFVVQGTELRSFEGEKVYSKYTCMNKKLNSDVFMENFNKIIKG